MEHRAFLFDTERYHAGLEDFILEAGRWGNTAVLEQYIDAHWDQLQSPYTADPLTENWRDELESGDVQELADFILTLCYDPEADLGLGGGLGVALRLNGGTRPEWRHGVLFCWRGDPVR